jgi:N-acetyl-beta-hexosaminidase
MRGRNWDKTRVENLIRVRGSERIGDDLPAPHSLVDAPTLRTPPVVVVHHPSTPTQNPNLASQIMRPVRELDQNTDQLRILNACSDSDLREARDKCQTVIGRLNEEMLKRSRKPVAKR